MKGKPKRFSLLAPGEDFAFGESGKNDEMRREQTPQSKASIASALAGVEGEHTPANTQGAGTPETAFPPKA